MHPHQQMLWQMSMRIASGDCLPQQDKLPFEGETSASMVQVVLIDSDRRDEVMG
jgi:hypothetical protein